MTPKRRFEDSDVREPKEPKKTPGAVSRKQRFQFHEVFSRLLRVQSLAHQRPAKDMRREETSFSEDLSKTFLRRFPSGSLSELSKEPTFAAVLCLQRPSSLLRSFFALSCASLPRPQRPCPSPSVGGAVRAFKPDESTFRAGNCQG